MKKLMLVAAMCTAAMVIAGCSKSGGASGGTQKVMVEVFDRGTDGGKTNPTNNQWTKWIKEKALKDENLDVQFTSVNRGDEQNALINLMAAGTPPDVCITYSIDNITSWALQGGLYDVSPYLDTTLKDLNEFLGPDKALPGKRMIERNRDSNTGAIYSIPARRMNVARLNTFIRQDWLNELGLPLPKTTEEFYAAMAAFKEKDPGKVGKEKVIPFTMSGVRIDWNAGNMLDSFIDPKISIKERWIAGAVERSFLLPGYKEGVRFLNKMYNAGLIDRDFPLYKDDYTVYNLLKSGVVGAFCHNWDQIYRDGDAILKDLQKNVPNAELVPVDCFTSSDGITHKTIYDAAGAFYFIPAGAKNPEAAMRYINWLARYENYHFIQIGPEGVVHTIENGVPKLIPSAPDGWIQNSAQNIDYTIMMNGLFLASEEENIKALANGYSWPADTIFNAYEMALSNGRPATVIQTTSPLVEAGPLAQTLTDKGVVIFTKSIQAKSAEFDSVYDSLVKDWLDSGAQKIVDERRAKFIDPF